MARISNAYRLIEPGVVSAATRDFLVKGGQSVALLWSNLDASGASTITVYGTLEPEQSRLIDDAGAVISPVGNGLWFQLPTQFSTQPTAAIGSEILPIDADPHTFVCVHVVTATEHDRLQLVVNNKTE
jgi:hypothetical protein